MPEQRFAYPRSSAVGFFLLAAALTFLLAASAFAQQTDDGERRRAFQLFDEQKFSDALPLLEKLAAAHPSDSGVIVRLGFSIFANSQTINDAALRKKERARAVATLTRAKELGVKHNLVEVILATVPPDGSERERAAFSKNKEADEAMRAGEAAFIKGDLDAALAAYEKALRLDPQLYEAPLFAGDMYLKKERWAEAGTWYARAIALNPDRETAYRYWGNAFFREGKMNEARDKYVEAIIADPYNQYTWANGLVRWADRSGVRLAHPKMEVPVGVSPGGAGQTNITLDPKAVAGKSDGSSAWLVYGLARAAWKADKFQKEFPEEKVYRRSLREEAGALRAVVESVRQQTKDGGIKQLDPALASLLKLEDEGLLEAFLLFARPDQGIVRDYATYRKSDRDKLRRYLKEYVASGKY